MMMLGMCSLGVSSPKQASTAQNRRMEKTLEKSAMKALTWRQDEEMGAEGVINGMERLINGTQRFVPASESFPGDFQLMDNMGITPKM